VASLVSWINEVFPFRFLADLLNEAELLMITCDWMNLRRLWISCCCANVILTIEVTFPEVLLTLLDTKSAFAHFSGY
jgi:hypothetical protein